MVTEVEMTVWIRLVWGSEKVKDQDVYEAHGKSAHSPPKITFLRFFLSLSSHPNEPP